MERPGQDVEVWLVAVARDIPGAMHNGQVHAGTHDHDTILEAGREP